MCLDGFIVDYRDVLRSDPLSGSGQTRQEPSLRLGCPYRFVAIQE